jgi:hypothetical protein
MGKCVVGLDPWLPSYLARSKWWTEPVRAERLAALRIGVGIVLLFDVLAHYLPQAGDFFGANSLGSPEVFLQGGPNKWRWSVLLGFEHPASVTACLAIWALAAICLTAGLFPRLSAAVAWIMSISVIGANWYLHNSGDNVRSIELFYLMLTPCAAAWSLSSWRAGNLGRRAGVRQSPDDRAGNRQAIYVPAWPLRLLFIQMMLIYFLNGFYKLQGPDWRAGNVMHYVMANLGWTRVSFAQFPLPPVVTQLLSWIVLAWEFGFPALVCMPSTRTITLWMGVAFHIGTGLFLPLGPFPLYMICLYLPLVPWERLSLRGVRTGSDHEPSPPIL